MIRVFLIILFLVSVIVWVIYYFFYKKPYAPYEQNKLQLPDYLLGITLLLAILGLLFMYGQDKKHSRNQNSYKPPQYEQVK